MKKELAWEARDARVIWVCSVVGGRGGEYTTPDEQEEYEEGKIVRGPVNPGSGKPLTDLSVPLYAVGQWHPVEKLDVEPRPNFEGRTSVARWESEAWGEVVEEWQYIFGSRTTASPARGRSRERWILDTTTGDAGSSD